MTEPCWACEGRGSSVHTCAEELAQVAEYDEQQARLRDAAPDLLEAARLIEGWIADTSGAIEDVRLTDARDVLRAAISKAVGP
jgi:hypothetical protein